MPYVALEDVGTTPRRSLSGRRRLQAWERTGGTCVVCGLIIDGVRERWIVEHIRALELGGADELDNMGPAHEACGQEKTRDDHARAAWAKRQKIKHLGAAVTFRPLPGSRICPLKRKVNGQVVSRHILASGDAQREAQMGWREAVEAPADPLPTTAMTLSDQRPRANRNSANNGQESGLGDLMTKQPPAPRIRERVGTNPNAASSEGIQASIPPHLEFLFNDRLLLPGENENHYDALRDGIIQHVKPVDIIEVMWVKDIVDLVWEAKRLRRWRNQALVHGRVEAAAELMRPAFQRTNSVHIEGITGPSVEALAEGWAIGNARSIEQVDKYLQERNLGPEDVTARAYLLSLPQMERIDRQLFLAEQRRDALLREIERKRAAFAQRMRTAATDILDVEDIDAR